MPEFYMIIAQKYFPRILGARPPAPTSYACAQFDINQHTSTHKAQYTPPTRLDCQLSSWVVSATCTKFATSLWRLPTGAFTLPTRRNSTLLSPSLFRLETVTNWFRIPYTHHGCDSTRRMSCVASAVWIGHKYAPSSLIQSAITSYAKGATTSKIKHAIKHKTSPARLAQLLHSCCSPH